MDSTRNTTSHEEARERIRRMLKERLRRRREERDLSQPPTHAEDPPLVHQAIKEEEKEKAREARWASITNAVERSTSVAPIAPLPSTPSTTNQKVSSSEEGWVQSDGRWAVQVEVYDGNLPPSVRARLEPVKGTHFRFREKADEEAFLSALSSPPEQLATYQPTGKKDVTLTSGDGRLLGNIHFLHMDGPDIHRPEKYYMKFYLFHFANQEILHDTRQRIFQFLQGFSHGPKRMIATPGYATPIPPSGPRMRRRIPTRRPTRRRMIPRKGRSRRRTRI